MLQGQGRLEESIQAFNQALEIRPNYADAYINLGVVLEQQGRLEESIEYIFSLIMLRLT